MDSVRAVWKGTLHIGSWRVPVKLYSAVESRTLAFRLLHEDDRVPVRQEFVSAKTGEVIPRGRARRAYFGDEEMVLLDPEELDDLEPERSRELQALAFLPGGEVDHRWYRRPYYLGPDDSEREWSTLVGVLRKSGVEGLVRWTMRDRERVGALRLHRGYPVLITLRSEQEVLRAGDIEVPPGPALDSVELDMARRLVDLMSGTYEPEAFRDEFDERIRDLIAVKARGGRVDRGERREAMRFDDVVSALRASLEREAHRA